MRKVEEFDDIDAALADLDARDGGLRSLQSCGERVLRKTSGLSGRDQDGAQRAVTAAPEGLQVVLPFLRARTYNAKFALGGF
jgi:hypothetical protein